MKTYQNPETKSLIIKTQTFLCGSQEPQAPGRMKLPSVTKTSGAWT